MKEHFSNRENRIAGGIEIKSIENRTRNDAIRKETRKGKPIDERANKAIIQGCKSRVEQAQAECMQRELRDLPIRDRDHVARLIGRLDGAWAKPLPLPSGNRPLSTRNCSAMEKRLSGTGLGR